MKFAARIFSFFLFFILTFLVFSTSAFAQQIQQKQNLHTYTQNVMIEVASSISCLLTGVDPVNPKAQCLGVKDGKIGPVGTRGGAIGAMSNVIAMTFTPPVHTGDYVKYLAGNFGISKPAYAANPDQSNGLGFPGLSSLFNLWTAFRNIAYLLFVLVFVIIGLAIMFRVHIDPRTVMSVENQIPKIIIGLIMVTFSIAIAGLLIDFMYLLIYLVIGIFTSVPNNGVPLQFYNMQGANPIEVANNLPANGLASSTGILGITTSVAGSVKDILVKSLLSGPEGKIIAFALGAALGFGGAHGIGPINTAVTAAGTAAGAGICAATGVGAPAAPICAVIGGTIGNLIATTVTGGVAATFSDQVLGGVAGLIAFVIIGLALLFALFRLWFTLIQAYIFILLDVALAPFWIIAGLVPGSSIGFGAWLKDLTANLLAFPATVTMFLLGSAFITSFKQPGPEGTFAPPLLGNANTPGLFGSLIGLGIILITPNILTMIKAALKAPKMDMAGIGMAVGAGVALPMNAFRQTGSTIIASREPIINTKTQKYEDRNVGRAILGGLFRR